MSEESIEVVSIPEQVEITESSSKPVDKTGDFVTKEEMNRIVHERTSSVKKKALQEGYEKAKSELQSNVSNNSVPSNLNTLSRDEVNRLIDERGEQAKNSALLNNAIESFHQKMKPGKESYKDFDEAIGKLRLPSIPEIALLASQVDNTSDVMYDLATNPSKISAILTLARDPNTVHLAQEAINQLATSIKNNKDPSKTHMSSKEPLSQIRSSTTYSDSGTMSSSDWKKRYSGRG